MSKTLKKALAIILTILMIVPTMPVAFADETAVEIEHQPTSGEPFVKLTDDADATYQWRSLNLGNEITAENAEVCVSGDESASYSAENGWSPVVWDNDLGGNHFTISLDKGQKITLKLDGIAYTIGIWNDTLDKGSYKYNVHGGLVTFEAPETADYYTYYYGPTPLNVKAYNGEYSYSSLVSEKEATLKNPVFGDTYFCRVTLSDGTVMDSDSFEYGYAITHQPTIEEPFVELNEDTDATYQWKTVTEEKVALDDTKANPSAYVTKTTYDAENGWNGDFCFNDETSAIFFGVNLKKGQKIYADFGEAVSGEIGIWDYSVNDGAFVADGTEDGKIEITAPWDGYFEFYANNVDSETRVIATTDGYKYDNIDNATEARYISTEELVFVCEVTFADGTTEMSETFTGAHEHRYEDVVTAPTCTENGYTTYTCACGDSYKDSETPATGHDLAEAVLGEYIVEPTCTESGRAKMVVGCKNCDEIIAEYEQNILPTGHSYDAVVTAPTCTTDGYTIYTCSACGDTYESDEVPATGHTEETLEAVAPTCTETGLTEGKKCTVCDVTTVEQEVVPVIEHSYTSEITTPATHTTEGVETFTCSVCNHTYTEVIEKTPDHLHEFEVTAPTCTEDGFTTYTCVCGDTYTADVVPATGHTEETLEAKAPTCTETGLTEGKKCTVCNEITVAQEVVPATGHTNKDAVEENRIEPSCTENGSVDKVVYCAVCDAEVSRTAETIDKVGHDYEAVVTAPTCTAKGYTTNTCKVCQHTYTSDEVEMIDHAPAEAVEENKVEPTCTTDGKVDMVVYCSVCNAELSREENVLPKTDHTPAEAVEEDKVDATCTTDGSVNMVVYCSVCNDKLSTEKKVLPKTDHTPAEEVEEIKTPATCEEAGAAEMVVYCSACDEKLSSETVTLEALGHEEEEIEVPGEAPTCTRDGYVYKVVRCKNCLEEYSRERKYIDATGHKNKEAVDEIIVAPTCTQPGRTYKVVYCENCNMEVSRVEVDVLATGHSYDAVVTAPTCTTDGYTTYTCSACGDTYTADVVPTTGHTEETLEAKAPTCTDAGLTEGKKCTVCGETTVAQEEIPATGHTETTLEAKAPTCTETGLTEGKKCSVCDEILEAQTEIPATGHTEETLEAKAPTCTETGLTEGKKCSVCDEILEVQTEIPATGHTEETLEAVEATCTETGLTEGKKCSVCGETTVAQEEIPATGHTEETLEAVEATCTETGLTEGKKCSVCNEITVAQEEIPATGHTPENAVEENKVEPTCTADGSVEIVVYCATCDAELSRDTEVITKTGHTPAEEVEENYVAPTCTSDGSVEIVVYCATCDAELSRENDVIAKIGHTPAAPVDENYVAPTCTETGSKDVVVYCSVCDAELSRDTVEVETAAHPDEENDGWCDVCGVQYCDHACHQTGFAKILYVIVLIFQMFFGANQYCECGVAHY